MGSESPECSSMIFIALVSQSHFRIYCRSSPTVTLYLEKREVSTTVDWKSRGSWQAPIITFLAGFVCVYHFPWVSRHLSVQPSYCGFLSTLCSLKCHCTFCRSLLICHYCQWKWNGHFVKDVNIVLPNRGLFLYNALSLHFHNKQESKSVLCPNPWHSYLGGGWQGKYCRYCNVLWKQPLPLPGRAIPLRVAIIPCNRLRQLVWGATSMVHCSACSTDCATLLVALPQVPTSHVSLLD